MENLRTLPEIVWELCLRFLTLYSCYYSFSKDHCFLIEPCERFSKVTNQLLDFE